MGESVSERRKVWIREHDYYAGNLFFIMPRYKGDQEAGYYKEHPFWLVWEAWGGHGGAKIELQGPEECRRLAGVLLEAADIYEGEAQKEPPTDMAEGSAGSY